MALPLVQISLTMPIRSPLNFIEKGPYGSPEKNFYHYRFVEVKHGRIAMAATVGMLVQENNRFQGFLSPSENLSFSDVPNGLAALDVVPLLGWVQLVVLIGAHELLVKQRPGKKPGDFGTGYLGVKMDDESAKQLRALNVEIQNGRLAMLGILGMFASEKIHVSAFFDRDSCVVHLQRLISYFVYDKSLQRELRFGKRRFSRRTGFHILGSLSDGLWHRFISVFFVIGPSRPN